MHPRSGFEDENINDLILPDGNLIDDDTKEEWRWRRNTLANLQLLDGRENERKGAKPLAVWLKEKDDIRNIEYLPRGISYELSNFEEFMEKRQELMKKELKNLLME